MSLTIRPEVRLLLLQLHPHTVLSLAGDVEWMLGYSASQLLQGDITFPSLVHTDDQDVLDEMLRSQGPSAAQPQPQVCNLRVRQANGRIRCLVVQHSQELAVAGPVVNLWLRDAKSLFDPADALADHPGVRSMMDNTNDFIFFKNRHHVFTSISQTLASLTQPSAHWTDLIGQTDYDIFPEAYADVYYRLEKQVFAGFTVAQEVQQYETLDGLKGWVDNRKHPIRNAQGEITGLFGIARVITDQVQAEEALRLERDSTRNILESVEAMIVALDTDGRITRVNRKGCQLLGYTEDELIGQDWFATCLPRNGDADKVRDVFKLSLAGNFAEAKYFENPVRTRNGEERLIAWRNCTICDKDGNIIGALSAGEDISERRAAALALEELSEELAASRDFLQLVIDTAPVRVFWKDRDSRYLGCNPAFARDAGKTAPSELIGLNDHAMGWAEQAELYIAGDRQVMEAGQLRSNIDEPQTTPDGKLIWLRTSKVPLRDAAGTVIGMLGVSDDVTERKVAEARLVESEQRYRLLLENLSSGVVVHNLDTSVQLANAMAATLLGLTQDQILGKAATDPQWCFLRSDATPMHLAEYPVNRVLASGEPLRNYLVGVRHPGRAEPTWVLCNAYPVRDDAGQISKVVVTFADITERKQAEEQLQLAAGVFTHAMEGIVITDVEGSIVDVNEAFTRITGYSRDEVLGRNPRMFKSGRQDAAFYASMWGALLTEGHWSGEVWNRHKTGRVFAEMLTISAVRDAAGTTQHYVALFSDITANKEHQNQLEHIAHFDALTGLPNRVLLADRLQQAMAQALRRQQQVAVVYLDLDGFKAINDRHDHQTGDQVLITLAQRMKEALREGDTMARIGGDEFVAVLTDLQDTSACVPLLGRLLAAAAEPVQVGDLILQVSTSLGVTFYPQAQDIEPDQLLRQADQAMYQAKVAGKNRYHVFDAAHDSSLRSHHESLERIYQALEGHEFVLHYQPKVNMHTGQVVGAEALIRWQHPDRGLLAPAMFLTVIEDHPLAVDVGEWVMDAALTQIEDWHAAGLDLPVSVNIGARQLQQVNFVERLQAILARHPQVNPRSLELEVLETSALADIGQVSQVIEDCARMGVRFALDDFGTGYSSLTYLKRLRVALLKIDQSFVRDMLDDPDDLAILQGVIGLAAAFNREVIAEGVETIAHGTALLQLGCQLAQGYGVARPMPAEHMAPWVASWRPDAAWRAAA